MPVNTQWVAGLFPQNLGSSQCEQTHQPHRVIGTFRTWKKNSSASSMSVSQINPNDAPNATSVKHLAVKKSPFASIPDVLWSQKLINHFFGLPKDL